MSRIRMYEARDRWTRGNNNGEGYAPFVTLTDDDSIESALEAAQTDGWQIILQRETSDDVAVICSSDGSLMAIGGDARGNGAWAVDIGRIERDDDSEDDARGDYMRDVAKDRF